MRRAGVVVAIVLLAACLAGCQGFVTTGGNARYGHKGNSGRLEVTHDKANGTTVVDLAAQVEPLRSQVDPGDVLEAGVALQAGKGSFKIELLGQDDQVTLTLESRDGETVTGSGQIVVNKMGSPRFRVTAVEAKQVSYILEYTIQ